MGTEGVAFVADADPSTLTDPLLKDSDAAGAWDADDDTVPDFDDPDPGNTAIQ